MKNFENEYPVYVESFERHHLLDFIRNEKEDNGFVETDEEFQEFLNSLYNLMETEKKLTPIFFSDIESNKLIYEDVFCEFLLQSIFKKDWARFLFIKDLYYHTKIVRCINREVCEAINLILEYKLETIIKGKVIEWSKGTFLENLVLMLNTNQENRLLNETLVKVVSSLDKDNIENFYVLNLSKQFLTKDNM